GVFLQFRGLRDHFGPVSLRPGFDREELRLLVRPGMFVWLQSACGVIFGQLDRILLAVSFGVAALAPYALCVQFAAPIFGLSASGLHFLFPLISRKAPNASGTALQHLLAKSFACNLLVVGIPSVALLAFGGPAIRLWSGGAITAQSLSILPGVVLGTVFMGLGVTGTYAMQALGQFRTVALLNIGGRVCALFLLVYLLRHHGIQCVVVARVCYGATALLVYVPLLRCLLAHPEVSAVHLVIAPWQQEMANDAGLGHDSRLAIHVAQLKSDSISRNLWHYRALPELANRLQPDLIHLTYPVSIDAAAFRCAVVLTLHDLCPY